MTTTAPEPFDDDHGDQFPGALPAPATPKAPTTPDRRLRMHAEHVHKINAVVASGNDDPARELAQSVVEESASGPPASPHDRRSTGRPTSARGHGGRPPGRLSRFTRRSLERFDRYTLDVFNAGRPYRSQDDRSV